MRRNTGNLNVTTQGDHEIVMTRVFHAPRRLVFDAHTKPALMKRWLGVFGGWALAVCEVDLRVGGTARYEWRHPEQGSMGMTAVFREVDAPGRLVNSERFDESWYEGEGVSTLVFTEESGITTLTNVLRYDTREIRDAVLRSPMEHGMAAGYDILDGVLAER